MLGAHPVTPNARILSERAAYLGLPAPGRTSSNGSCRLVRSQDRWLAVNLARPEDREMLPALVGRPIDSGGWEPLEAAAASMSSTEILSQARLLGMPVSGLGEHGGDPPEALDPCGREFDHARTWDTQPFVIDLSALWAGPLCGALLAEAGCAVIKVETRARPDSTAQSCPAFHGRLNGAKTSASSIWPRRPINASCSNSSMPPTSSSPARGAEASDRSDVPRHACPSATAVDLACDHGLRARRRRSRSGGIRR